MFNKDKEVTHRRANRSNLLVGSELQTEDMLVSLTSIDSKKLNTITGN